ncbi:hypothetical protein C2E23DRAFT_438729 [Lenzites betulinus]|nr:hypothetical protein C2E23DRAFT_438729 [Lenzites betulinus]
MHSAQSSNILWEGGWTAGSSAPSPIRLAPSHRFIRRIAPPLLFTALTYKPLRHRLRAAPEDMVQMVVQVTHCLYSVREVAGILSGDVSPQNIMWTDSALQDGRPAHFVLHDFERPNALRADSLCGRWRHAADSESIAWKAIHSCRLCRRRDIYWRLSKSRVIFSFEIYTSFLSYAQSST